MNRPAPAMRVMIKRLMIGLLILSTVLVYFFSSARNMFSRNRLPLPLGYSYQLQKEKNIQSGRIQSVYSKAIQTLFGDGLRWDLLILKSWLYSPKKQSVDTDFFGNGSQTLYINEAQLVNSTSIRHVLKLEKGYNNITIIFSPNKNKIPELAFRVQEEVPFYYFIIPQSRTSIIISSLLSFLDRYKLVVFVLSFFFLLFKIVPAALSIGTKQPVDNNKGFFFQLFRAFSFFLVFTPLAIYLNHALGLDVSDYYLLLGSSMGSLWILLKYLFRGKPSFRFERTSFIVFSLVAILVFSHIFLTANSFLPPPAYESDLSSHLRMMQYYKDVGDFYPQENFNIYPQGTHVFLVLIADIFDLPFGKILIIFLVIVLIMIYDVIYLLSRELFGRIHFVYFFLALSLSYFLFIYRGLFITFSFPSILAIFFFLLSLYLFLKRDFLVSSVSLASAILAYPYYVIFFIAVILFLFMERLNELNKTIWQKLKQLIQYFSLPLFSSSVYFFIYWTYGFSQEREGFNTSYKINPFMSMHIINALLFLGGMFFLIKSKKNKKTILMVLGIIVGFLIYYVPYYLFSLSSTYYFMKNMQYVILLSIPIEMFALSNIFQRFEKKVYMKYSILLGAIGIFILRVLGLIYL